MKHSFIAFLALTFFLFSCKKNHDDVPAGPASGSIKLKTLVTDYGTNTYTYDSKGRLLLKVRSSGSKSEFDYSNPNKIIEKYYFPDGSLEGTGEYDLNAAGLIIKSVYSDGPANLFTAEYDANKNVIKTVALSGGNTTVVDYFYTNGSLDSLRYKSNGNFGYTSIYTYYTNKADVLNSDTYGQAYEGYKGKYLLKQEDTRFADGTHNVWDYTYEFDGQGRVTKNTGSKGQDIDIRLYTYH